MKITIATKEDILSYIENAKHVVSTEQAMRICTIDSETDEAALGIYLDKNADSFTCYSEDDTVHYDEEYMRNNPIMSSTLMEDIQSYIKRKIDSEMHHAFATNKED